MNRAGCRCGAPAVVASLAFILGVTAAQGQPLYDHDVLRAFSDPPKDPRANVVQGSDGALYGTTSQGGAHGSGVIFKMATDGSGFTVLHEFDVFDGPNGASPEAGLIQATDGLLYGSANGGGANGYGVLYRIATDGSAYAKLHDFDLTNGGYPRGPLIQGSDGALYGATYFGGSNGGGVVFKMATDGTGFARLHDFSGTSTDGRSPVDQLIQATDGLLYGATGSGGATGGGTVFKIGTDGTGFAVVHHFTGNEGVFPDTPLIQGADGLLYGATALGGASHAGVIFRVATDGSAFAIIHEFVATDGSESRSSLVQAADGALYGTRRPGSSGGRGFVFKMSTDGAGFTVLHTFDGIDGDVPQPAPIQAADGALYGVTQKGGSGGRGVVFKMATDGSAFALVYEFEGADPANPQTALTLGADGALYGTTYSGGTHDAGTIFKVNDDGSGFTLLHEFDAVDPLNGAVPMAGVIQAADGLLYGTTMQGGAGRVGVLYRIAPDGAAFTKLHDFDTVTGKWPEGPLIQASDGALYGTAFGGGAAFSGVLFRIATDGSGYTDLRDFGGYLTDGVVESGVIQGSDGALYGTSFFGGPLGQGIIFKVAPDGTGFKKLHDFDGTHGGWPYAGLIQASDGALYGTTQSGGTHGSGVLFKIKATGLGYTVLHSFDRPNGWWPDCVLMRGFDGALYGTTDAGGGSGNGVAFKVGTSGLGFTKLHDFAGGADGANPVAGLVQGTDGALYGTTSYGGSGGGTVFRLATQTLSVSDVSVGEGDVGTAPAVFTVSLAQAGSKVVTVRYATANGTALAGSDYIGTSGILTFNPGEKTKAVSVMANGDTLYEADETFSLRLSAPVNATLATDEGSATILNDDAPPTLSVGGASVLEGDVGVRNAVFTVTLSGRSGATTTVHYATMDGAATAGSDYTAVSGTLTFPAGAISKTASVPVKGDTAFEPTETFDLVLSDPVNAAIADDTAVGTILNDDGAGTFQFSAANYSVGEAMPYATITVTRVNGKQAGATVEYETADGTAVQPADYRLTHGTLTFAANQASATFRVRIVNDAVHESPKTLLLSLGNPQPTATGAGLGAQSTAVLTIVDNDVAATIRFSAATYTASEGVGSVKLTVKRVGALAVPGVSFHYATGPGTATGGGTDYDDASGDLTFASSGIGATTQTITVPIKADTVAEGSETFTVILSSPVNGILGSPATATVTIANDDATVQFSAGTYAVNEATPKATISVKRTGSLLGTVTVHYSTSDGTATSARYVPTSGDLTFGPGVSVRTFPVSILNDAIDEGTQTVNLILGPSVTWDLGTPAIGGTNPAVLSITDDEPTVQFSAATYSVSEALNSVLVSVRRTGSLVGTATVHYATSDGSATSADYVPTSGDLAFLSGQAARTFPITLNPDTVADGSRTINLALSAASGVALGTPSTSVVTIRDNDVAGKVQFSASNYSVSEGDGSISITVTRIGGTSSDATVDYSTADGAGVQGTDYTTSSGTLTFGLNEKAKTFTIPMLDDGTANPGVVKDVILTLGSPGNGLTLGAPSSATLWILKE